MKRLLTALLLACAVLCGSACGKREPNKIDRDALTETGTGTGASDAGSDHTQLPVYHPLRIEKASKWDGIIQTVASDEQVFTFSHGLGTEEEPFLLTDAEDLAHFAANVRYAGTPGTIGQELTRYAGVHFRLECDIDLQGQPWIGIGGGGTVWDDATLFAGVFDGNGHVIYNFAPENRRMNGFFSEIGRGAVIKNLCIASGSVRVRSGEAMGLLAAGVRYGATIENCTIRMGLAAGSGVEEILVGAVGTSMDGAVVFRNCDFSGTKLNGKAYDLPEVAKIN